jgi:hypothetical protein
MENTINFVILASQYLGIDPKGIITGLIGATFSVLVLNRNKFSVSKVILIIFSGAVLSGYGIHIYLRSISLKILKEQLSLVYSVSSLVSFLATYLSSIKTAAPTLTNSIVTGVTNLALKLFSAKYSVDVKPNKPDEHTDHYADHSRTVDGDTSSEGSEE